jgi:hypothetical protein
MRRLLVSPVTSCSPLSEDIADKKVRKLAAENKPEFEIQRRDIKDLSESHVICVTLGPQLTSQSAFHRAPTAHRQRKAGTRTSL